MKEAVDMSTNPIAQQLVERASQAKVVIATAESCTGGLVAGAITDVSGSSAVLDCGLVTYANAAKQHLLQVPDAMLTEFGAVSREVAEAMLAGLWLQSAAQIGVAITGIAGPDGGTTDKPVGLVWFAWGARNQAPQVACERFEGDRAAVRAEAVDYALNRLLDSVDTVK